MVLLIDDNPQVRLSRRKLLTELGYTVSAPSTERGWLYALTTAALQLIIVDYGRYTETISGADIVRVLRKPGGPREHIPIIGIATDEACAELVAAGADYVLQPSLPAGQCARVIQAALSRTRRPDLVAH